MREKKGNERKRETKGKKERRKEREKERERGDTLSWVEGLNE